MQTKTWFQSCHAWLLDEIAPWHFPVTFWCVSRLLICLAFFVIAPLLNPAVAVGSYAFIGGDGEWYLRIATEGYTLDPDGALRSAAFFPLYPLLIRLLMGLHLNPIAAGLLINNVAFLSATLVLYHWMKRQLGLVAARWTTAVLTLCPLSIFGSVLYSEGLFLLLTTIALYAFTTQQWGKMAIAGLLATAVRPPGMALIPSLGLQSWREQRSPLTYAAILAIAGGIVAYSLFCAVQLGHPLAFAHAQAYWGRQPGDLQPWLRLTLTLVMGETNYHAGRLVRLDHPLSVGLVGGLALLVWCQRDRLGRATPYWTFVTVCACWIVGDFALLRLVSLFGGAWLLWRTRQALPGVVTLYGFCSLGLLLVSGHDLSAERLAYGIVSLAIAAGVALAQRPRVGYGLMPLSAIVLVTIATQLGQGILVA